MSGLVLTDGSVTTTKLADGTVTTAKIANLAVDSTKLADNAVTSSKIADGSVTGVKLANLSVDGTKLADGSVSTSKIVDGAITGIKLANLSVDGSKIADGSITPAKLSIPLPTLRMAMGEYTGNATNNRKITGLGFSPDFLLIYIRDQSGPHRPEFKARNMPGERSQDFDGNWHPDPAIVAILSLDADGFTLGPSGITNQAGVNFGYIAFGD